MKKYHGGVNEYRSSEVVPLLLRACDLKDTLQDILGVLDLPVPISVLRS